MSTHMKGRENSLTDHLRVVAIDGVLGAGKTTVARRLATRLGLEYLDTGAMYRCIGLACRQRGFVVHDAASLEGDDGERLRDEAISVARSAVIEVRTDAGGEQRVLLDGADVSADVRTPETARAASVVATVAEVRHEMVERQRSWARARGGGVLEGRDIATVVFPNAPVRIFLTAEVGERARRRHAEQPDRSFDDVVADLQWRDHNDSSRDVAPLSVAEGATVLDTTGLTLEQVVDQAVAVAEQAFGPTRAQTAPSRVAVPAIVAEGPSAFDRRLWASLRPLLLGVVKVYFRATWEGTENIPTTGPVILAPVHRSNIDTIVVPFLARRRVRFLGKSSMWKISPVGRLFTRLGAIKIDRGTADRESMTLCLNALRAGEPLVVYPEGTRKEGPVVDELFDGVAWLAARTQATIVPIGIGGSAAAMGRSHKFPRPRKVHLIVGRPISPPLSTGRTGLRRTTTELQTELQALFDAAQVHVYGRVPAGS